MLFGPANGHASVVWGLARPDGSIEAGTHEQLIRMILSADARLAWRCEFRLLSDQFWPLQTTDSRRSLEDRVGLSAKWAELQWHCREQYASLPMARVVATRGPDQRPDGRVLAETVLEKPFQKMAYRASSTLDCQNADMELLNSRNNRDHEDGDGEALCWRSPLTIADSFGIV